MHAQLINLRIFELRGRHHYAITHSFYATPSLQPMKMWFRRSCMQVYTDIYTSVYAYTDVLTSTCMHWTATTFTDAGVRVLPVKDMR